MPGQTRQLTPPSPRSSACADRAPADALWLRVIRSPHASATFRFGDLDGFVARHPGLAGVVLPEDIPFNRFAIFPDLRDQPAIAEALRLPDSVFAGFRDSLQRKRDRLRDFDGCH